ncbi:toxin-antitoxin system, antitoxin component, ribbon-helix-helix domain protein [Bordetella bronchiseptica CA90 BB02]|nr:toxin-antitoxin system, antitoxin component, ribbon-helix-helix domain protein [Bordetella bronchiseptica CA90 BB02]
MCISVFLLSLVAGTPKGKRMANLNIRNLPDEVHQALKVRAALNNRSTEAEIREILTAAVQPLDLEKMGRAVGLEKPAKK